MCVIPLLVGGGFEGRWVTVDGCALVTCDVLGGGLCVQAGFSCDVLSRHAVLGILPVPCTWLPVI